MIGHLLPLQQHPLLQGIQYPLALRLAHCRALWDIEFLDLAFDLLDPCELFQRELGDLTFVGGVQVKELASRMNQVTHLGHTTGDQGLVPAEVVTGEAAFPVAQKRPRMLACARFAEVVHHCFDVFKGPGRVGLQVGPMRLAISQSSGLEHGHWCLVGVQHTVLEDHGLQGVDQRLQPNSASAHPLRQGGARDSNASPAEDGLLAVQGQMVRELGHQHLGQQARRGYALVDDMRLDLCLGDGLALGASPLAADVALHAEHARHIVQLFDHILADPFHLAAAPTGSGLRLVVNLAPG